MALRTAIARHRRSPLVGYFARKCRTFVHSYENDDYRITTNGEDRVLEKLSEFGLSTIFDVGANVGEWTILAARYSPDSAVHSFEIVPLTYKTLAENTNSLGKVTVNNIGLSDRRKDVELRYYPDASGLTTVYDYPHPLRFEVIKAGVVSGDEYMSAADISSIDFMKIDVEGTEHEVLAGFKEAFRNKKIEAVQFEYGKVNILTHYLLRDFYEFFEEHGFKVGKIYPTYVDFRDYVPEHEDFIGPNFIGIKKGRTDLIDALRD